MRCVNLQGTIFNYFFVGNNKKRGCQSKNAKLFVIIDRDVNILIKFVFC